MICICMWAYKVIAVLTLQICTLYVSVSLLSVAVICYITGVESVAQDTFSDVSVTDNWRIIVSLLR